MLKLTFEGMSISGRARIQTRAATVNLWHSTPVPEFSEPKSNNRPLCNKECLLPSFWWHISSSYVHSWTQHWPAKVQWASKWGQKQAIWGKYLHGCADAAKQQKWHIAETDMAGRQHLYVLNLKYFF